MRGPGEAALEGLAGKAPAPCAAVADPSPFEASWFDLTKAADDG